MVMLISSEVFNHERSDTVLRNKNRYLWRFWLTPRPIISLILIMLCVAATGLGCSSPPKTNDPSIVVSSTAIVTTPTTPLTTTAINTPPATPSWSVYKAPGTAEATTPVTNPPKTTTVAPNPNLVKVSGINVTYYEIQTNGIIQLNIKPVDRDGSLVPIEGPFDVKVWTTASSGPQSGSNVIIQKWDNVIIALTDYSDTGVNLSFLYAGGFLENYDDPGYVEVSLATPGVIINGRESFENLQPVL
jgi:hypothetical protein